MADCLESLVGLTDIECDCYSDLQPSTFNESESGRFLTDQETGFPLLDSVFQSIDCGENFWNLMTKARSSAILDTKHELSIAMAKYNDRKLPVWKGEIGRRIPGFIVQPAKKYTGVVLRFAPIRDAFLVIKELWLNISTNSTVTLNVISNDPDFTPVSVQVTTTANKPTIADFSSEIKLPFFSEREMELTYLVYYELPSGAKTVENMVHCGCSRMYNDVFPKYIQAGNFNLDTLDNMHMIVPGGSCFGLTINGYMDCDDLNFLCNLKQLGAQFIIDDLAAAIQAKGAAKLISSVIDSGEINRYTLKPIEELYGRRQRLLNNFQEYIDNIAKNFSTDLSGCWVCKSNSTWRKQSIVV